MKRTITHIVLVLLAFSMVGTAGYLGYQSTLEAPLETPAPPSTVQATQCDVYQTVTAPGKLVNTLQQTIVMPASGRLAEIDVKAGEIVSAGQMLARLDNEEEYAVAVAAARLELLQAEHDLDALYNQAPTRAAEARLALVEAQGALDEAQKARKRLDYPRADETTIEAARTHYALMQDAYQGARKEYEHLAHLLEDDPNRARALSEMIAARKELDQAYATLNWYTGKPSDQDYAEADAKLALAETQLAEAEQAWERLKEGVDELELELANARLDNARVKLASAEAVLASLELTAPFDGVVLEVDAQPGEALAVGQAVLVLSDPKAVEVQATVIEEDLPYVETGQGVDLFFDALPDVEAHGRVDRILPKRLPGDRPLYTIYITLDDVPDKLVDGMTADASIVIAQRESVLCLPRGVVRASSSGTAVIEIWTGTEIERRTIEIGLRGDVQVEILSGLEEGELVVAK